MSRGEPIGSHPWERSRAGKILDTIFFPLRALFLGEQGAWGLSSIRDERMRMVARYCQGRVLDIGCGPGNLFVSKWLAGWDAVGVDVYPYEGVELVVEDMTHLPFGDEEFDTVTLIAVGGHIPRHKRAAEFQEFARVLRPGGRLLMTEGEPVTQFLRHKWLQFYLGLQGRQDMDTCRGMAEDEEYCMPRQEIFKNLNTPPLRLVARKRFMWGLNNLYIARKQG